MYIDGPRFFVFQDKLIRAIKRIQHEVDECREAESETYIDSVQLEVQSSSYSIIHTNLFWG